MGPVVAACLMKLLSRAIPNSDVRAILASLILVPALAIFVGSGVYRSQVRAWTENSRQMDERYRADLSRKEALEARLTADPEVALRERWYVWEKGKEQRRYVLLESLRRSRVPYTPDLLAKIYQKVPEAGSDIVSHPACDAEFLANHWNDALVRTRAGDDKVLIAMVSNPQTPPHLVEALESPEILKAGKELRAAIDLRLHGADLVMTKGSWISFAGDRGVMDIWAGTGLGRSYTWKDVNKDTVLEAREKSVGGVREVYFQGLTNWHDHPHDDTDSGEFREGRKNFGTLEEAVVWLRLQSEKYPTVHRNDGLVVSCGRDAKRRQIAVEVWQILVNGTKPTTLPGSDDSNISFSSR